MDQDLKQEKNEEISEQIESHGCYGEETNEQRMFRQLDNLIFMYETLKKLKVDYGLTSVQMLRSRDTYYSLSLEQRQQILQAPSTFHLCKTLIMKNSLYNEQYKDDPFYPRLIIVIVQYEKKLKSQDVAAEIRNYQRSHYQGQKSKWVGRKDYKFRQAETADAYEVSGYQFNGIMPFFTKDQTLPILLSKDIYDLVPKYFWLGGGRPELKIGISVDEFMQFFGKRVIVGDIS